MSFPRPSQPRPGPYAQQPAAPKQPNPAFGQCAGCGGGRYLWQPKSGKYEGQSLIACCLPFEQRQGACREYMAADMQTGHPAPRPAIMTYDNDPGSGNHLQGGQSMQTGHPGHPGALVPAPEPSTPSGLEAALGRYCEQMHEMVTHQAEIGRLLSQIVSELAAQRQ